METKIRAGLTPVLWSPLGMFEDLEKFIGERMLDSNMFYFPDAANQGYRVPAIDLRDEGNRYVLSAELPGLTKEDVSVEIIDGVLEISAVKECSKEEKDEGYVRRERGSMQYHRRYDLPEDVDADAIEAKLSDGVLELALPKLKVAEPAKKKVNVQ
ncbi:MAG: Hsp20/alpha crystallin family protein [Methanomassiliicoccales archaeon]|jgi:HSP20 family protein